MSIKEQKSVMSILVKSDERRKGYENTQDDSSDAVESEDSCKERNHKLSLEFRCSDTPMGQRKLCKSFWEVIDQHPELDHIMARGWSEKDVKPKAKPVKKKPHSATHCDELQEFLNHKVDKLVLFGLKNVNNQCSTELKLKQSSSHLFGDLQDFDSRVKTENSIPPKTPRPTRSQQEVNFQHDSRAVIVESSQEGLTKI